ncbi:MAG: beta-galactosidase [Kiritimatiellae bacterium]|nr:beta-galactosidase [Kiritimatiellia bacterium]
MKSFRMCVTTAIVSATAFAVFAEPMMTPWGEKVTSENAWRGYPRPQMVRAGWTCLNGEWDYAIDAITNALSLPGKVEGKIRVPFALESPLSGCGGRLLAPDEYLWYTREVELDPKPGERLLLHFGAVDYRAIVYLGHDEVAVHDGGNLPFTADITPYAKKGVNRLSVLVWDPTEDFVQARGKQAFKTHACFYTRSSGIIQTVWLETVPETYIADYCVTTDIDKGEVTIELKVESGKCSVEGAGAIEIENPVDPANPVQKAFTPGIPCTIRLPAPVALWSPENPNLYSFTARYGADEIKGYFGMRKFEKRKDEKGVWRFFLNNRPYYVMATLDQGWWPDGLLTPPSEETMAFDIQTLKDCGFNTMRKHIKVEPLRYYALCDRMGLLVLQDMPCTSFDPQATYKADSVKGYGLFREELKGMVDLLRKVPSIVMWIPYNEGWGQHDPLLTHTTLDFVKRYDPTRLVDGPSGWNDFEGGERRNPKGYRVEPRLWKTAHRPESECEASDIVDLHRYRGPVMPEVNSRRVSFLGEFGGLGHPVDGHLWDTSPKDARGNWGYGGVEDTKTREGLEKTYLELMDKLGQLAEQGLGGSVYTQTTDVEIEVNGLLTYDRKVLKYNPEVLRKAHAEVIRRALDATRTSAFR